MQIGPMPASPEKVMPRQPDAAVRPEPRANTASSLPTNRGSQSNKPDDIRKTTQDLERVSMAFNRRLQFVVDHESNDVTVKVIDTETDKVIKVLPPEELQRLHQRIRETIGFLYDQKV